MAIHELKTWSEAFAAVASGEKKHEIRVDDRGFALGDVLLLREWFHVEGRYSGRAVVTSVTHKTPGGTWGLPADLCVMSLGAVVPVGKLPEDIQAALAARGEAGPVDEASR